MRNERSESPQFIFLPVIGNDFSFQSVPNSGGFSFAAPERSSNSSREASYPHWRIFSRKFMKAHKNRLAIVHMNTINGSPSPVPATIGLIGYLVQRTLSSPHLSSRPPEGGTSGNSTTGFI
jgi:hypothetical protein